jgi:hypothetical protein
MTSSKLTENKRHILSNNIPGSRTSSEINKEPTRKELIEDIKDLANTFRLSNIH